MMSREIITGIYKITNKVNGKCYIGQAQDVYIRWNNHRSCAFNKNAQNYNLILYRAFRKYGLDNFKFEIIEKCSLDELNEKEMYYINYYNSYIGNDNSNGYNMTIGGDGVRGHKMSNESKLKMIKNRKGKNTGKDNKSSRAVVCNNKYFNSITECAEYYNENYYSMRDWLNGYNNIPKKYYDLRLHYADKEFERHNYIIQHSTLGENNFKSKSVICEGIEFANVRECSEYYNINETTLYEWLSHINNMPKEWFDKGLHYKDETMNSYIIQKGSLKGKDNPCSKKIICEGKEYGSVRDCSEYYGVVMSTMTQWLNHNNKMPKKFYDMGLHYKDEPMENYEVSKKYKLVICDNKIFNSIKECATYYDITPSTMQRWLNGKNKIPQKFINLGLKYYD